MAVEAPRSCRLSRSRRLGSAQALRSGAEPTPVGVGGTAGSERAGPGAEGRGKGRAGQAASRGRSAEAKRRARVGDRGGRPRVPEARSPPEQQVGRLERSPAKSSRSPPLQGLTSKTWLGEAVWTLRCYRAPPLQPALLEGLDGSLLLLPLARDGSLSAGLG